MIDEEVRILKEQKAYFGIIGPQWLHDLGWCDWEIELQLLREEQMEKQYEILPGVSSADALNTMCKQVHKANEKWWLDLSKPNSPELRALGFNEYQKLDRNVGEMLCLVHSEISEALEGHRKGLMDDKLPHRKQIEVELADAIIRIFDICEGLGLDLGGAYEEKMAYNANRADHKIENRMKEGGKKY